MSSIEELEKTFHGAPTGENLVALYRALKEELLDSRLAGILDKIRPIQHRVTLIQADASPGLLEALSRDPHRQVRTVVATHANINDEVCFRLGEDQEAAVRLALRKNPRCHPVIRAAVVIRDRSGDEDDRGLAELLLESAWQARRAGLDCDALCALIEEWTGLSLEQLPEFTVEQAHLVLDVLAAKLGQGRMPSKAKKPKAKKKR